MDQTTGREAYRAARDILVRHRDDYDGAVAAFRWPAVGERFNWALDWFDAGWPPNRATADAIFAHARQNLWAYQRIRRIEFMELPKTISGKIRRVDLRARENSCEPDALMDEYRDRCVAPADRAAGFSVADPSASRHVTSGSRESGSCVS
jgi:hypothetical protein